MISRLVGQSQSVVLGNFVDQLLSFKEIVILGDNYDGKSVEKVIAACISELKNLEEKPVVKFCLKNVPAHRDLSFCYVIDKLVKQNNTDKALVVCNDFEMADRLYLNLMKSDFGLIVKGKQFLNCWYQNIVFRVEPDDAGTERVEYCACPEKDDNSKSKELCRQLYNDKSADNYLAVIDYYTDRNNLLLAYDYCLRALSHFCDERIIGRKEHIGSILEKRDISYLDYVNAMEKYVDIAYFGRSGSIYFQSLLEGHSGIITIPAGIIYFPYHRLYSLYYSKKGCVTINDIVTAMDLDKPLLDNYREAIHIRTENGEALYPLGYIEKYKFYIRKILNEKIKRDQSVDEKFLIKTIFLAHHLALGRTIDYKKGIPYILNHLHTSDLDMEAKFLKFFPDTNVLCTVRNLIQNFGSNINSYLRNFDSDVVKSKTLDLFFYYFDHPLFQKIGKEYKIFLVPLEKVNKTPENLLKEILNRLDLVWEDVLMQSTINGLKMYDRYEANAAFLNGARVTGISRLYDEYFDSFDRYRLEVLYSPILSKWNYPYPDYIDIEYVKSVCGIPFRFEKAMKFKDDKERELYGNKIKRLLLRMIERRDELGKSIEGHEIL